MERNKGQSLNLAFCLFVATKRTNGEEEKLNVHSSLVQADNRADDTLDWSSMHALL